MIARRCFGPTTPTRATARGARNRQGASQAGSCQTANDGSDKSGMGVPRSIETRNKTHACMALRRNETKKNTVLRIRMGRDQGRGRCLVALAGRSNLALISRSVSGIGKDARFWKLAQSLSALYPPGIDEKRWVDGVLVRKESLGL